MPSGLILKVGSIALYSLILIIGTWKTHSWKDKSEQLKQVNASIVELKQRNSAESKESVNRQKAQEVHHDKQKEAVVHIEREVTAMPVYRECVVPASGLRVINSAVEGANTLISSC